MSALGSLVVKLALEYAEYTKGLDKSSQESLKFAQNTQKHFDAAASSTKEFFVGVVQGAVAAGAAYLSVGAVIDGLKNSIDSLAALDDMSQKTGSSVENLSRLQKVAAMTGAEFGNVDSAISKLAKGMATVDDESNKTNKALGALGISSKDITGKLRDPSEVMVDVAKKLQGYKDGAGKAALANDLFGKSGADLLPYLNDVAENVDKFTGVATEATRRATELQDKMGLMRVKSKELYDSVAIDLVPAFIDVIDVFTRAREESQKLSGNNDLKSWGEGVIAVMVPLANTIDNVVSGIQLANAAVSKIAASRAVDKQFDAEKDKVSPSNMFGLRLVDAKSDAAKKLDEIEARRVAAQKAVEDSYENHHDKILSEVGRFNRAYDALQKSKTGAARDQQFNAHKGVTAPVDDRQDSKYRTGNAPKNTATAEKVSDYEKLTRSINEKIAASQMELTVGHALTESEKIQSKMLADLAAGKIHLTKPELDLELGRLRQLDTLNKSIEANKQIAKLYADAAQVAQAAIDNAIKEADANERLATTFGMSKAQIEAQTLARLEEKLAQRSATGMTLDEIQALEKLIDAKKRNAAALGKIDALEAADKANKKLIAEQEKTVEKYDDIFRSGFADMLNNGRDAWGSFTKSLTTTFKTTVADQMYKMFAQPFVVKMVASLLGVVGGSAVSGVANAATGGGMNMLSTGKSLWDGFSGGMTAGMGSGIAAVGNAFGASSVSAFGAGLAGNTSVGLMTASETFASAGMAAEASAASLGASVAAAVPYIAAAAAVAYVLKAGFGHGERETTSRGIEGSFGGSGFAGNNFNVWKEEGGWFTGDNNGRDTSALDAVTAKQFSSGYAALQSASINAAKALGLSADSISSYSEQISLVLTGDKAKDAEAITKLFADLGDHMATAAAPGIAAFAKEGETASATLSRLSGSITTANAWLSMLKQRLFQVSMAGADAASKLADAFGGLDSLTAASKAFYDAYYTDGERAARSMDDMTKALASVNLSMPATKDQLRALAGTLDLNTESGRKAYATLLAIAPEFAAVADITAKLAKETANKLIATFTGGGQLMPALNTAAAHFDALTGSIGSTTGNATGLKDQAWAMGMQLFDAAGNAITLKNQTAGLSGQLFDAAGNALNTSSQLGGLTNSIWNTAVNALNTSGQLGVLSGQLFDAAGRAITLRDQAWAMGAQLFDAAGRAVDLREQASAMGGQLFDAAGKAADLSGAVMTVGQYADGTAGIMYGLNDSVWQVGVHADGTRGLMFALTDAVWAAGANAAGTAGTMYGLNDSVWTVGQYADGTRGALYSLNDSVWQVGVHADGTRGLMFALTDAVWAVGANANGTSAAVAGFSDSIGFMVPVLTSTAAAAGYVSLLFTGTQSGLLSFGDNVSLLSPVFDKTGNSAGTIASVMAGAEFGIASFGGATVSFGNDVAGLIPSVNGASDAVGSISTRFLDVQSGLISFDGSASTLQATFTGAQLAGLLLNNEIDDLRLGADKTRIDIAGLGDALADVNTETFVTTMGLVFDNLATRIRGVIDGISAERIAVREAALQIVNPTVMSKDAIQRGIAGVNTALPSNAGVVNSGYWLGVRNKEIEGLNSNLSAQRGLLNSYNDQLSANKNWLAQINNARASESAYADRVRADLADLSDNSASATRDALMAKDRSELARVAAEMVEFDAATNIASANINSLTGSVAAQQAVVAQAEASTANWTAGRAGFEAWARNETLAYTAALQNFAVDAGKSVTRLTKLREETVKYYDAQKQLADLMGKSAAGLRGTVADYKYSQLSAEQQFNDLQAKYATAYSMALSTDGESLAGYGDKLNSMLNPLLEKAKEVYGSDSAYNAFAATALARAETIAGRLETLTPTNYAADSLAMLGQIDVTLAALDASSKSAEKLITDAINAGSDKTASGLHAVIAALTGQAIPGFAAGGDFGGGLRIVGENGPELEATGPSRIFNASQTRAMLSGGGNSEVVAELRALRQDNANMRAELLAIALNTGNLSRLAARNYKEGTLVRTDADTPLTTVAA